MFIGGGNNFGVAHGAAGLYHGSNPMLCDFIETIAKGNKASEPGTLPATGNCARIAPIFTESIRDI